MAYYVPPVWLSGRTRPPFPTKLRPWLWRIDECVLLPCFNAQPDICAVMNCCVVKYTYYCQQTSPKRWFGSMTLASNCEVTHSAHQIQMTAICHWMKPHNENFLRTPQAWRLCMMRQWLLNTCPVIYCGLAVDRNSLKRWRTSGGSSVGIAKLQQPLFSCCFVFRSVYCFALVISFACTRSVDNECVLPGQNFLHNV